MRFFEVPIGQRFKIEDVEYLKIPEERVSCCKVQANALQLSNNTKIVVSAQQNVEVVIE
jgi:hypothetical protein